MRKDMLAEIICELIQLRAALSEKELEALLRAKSKMLPKPSKRISKKELLSFYLAQKSQGSALWQTWDVTPDIDDALIKLLRAKPRRTASGVATVTVITKPWPCAGDCICCPNDIRMPKSYLSDEPACQRAERCWFDPYLQVGARLGVLEDMGHNIDKIELIVLGGTFSDYPESYRLWFIEELFECLNDYAGSQFLKKMEARRAFYKQYELENDEKALSQATAKAQAQINAGLVTYNEIIDAQNSESPRVDIAKKQIASYEELANQQLLNESAAHRVVGLCVETRPELATPKHLAHLRALGCTKLQIGIQSLNDNVLQKMNRKNNLEQVADTMALLRLFGFKSHVHMMANLPGATPETDKQDFAALVGDARYMPDEIKLYPCVLVESSQLGKLYEHGEWAPYEDGELIDVLAANVMATPAHTRISRMIRDISSKDIIAGNKHTNLRQTVESSIRGRGCFGGFYEQKTPSTGQPPKQPRPLIGDTPPKQPRPLEMRMREISTGEVSAKDFRLDEVVYETTNTTEYFLQFVNDENMLAAFCRLSLPRAQAVEKLAKEFPESPICQNTAMIREVHVYGRVSKLHETKEGAQHLGFGRALIKRACEISAAYEYSQIAVISAVGTREYYASLGFKNAKTPSSADLYQIKAL